MSESGDWRGGNGSGNGKWELVGKGNGLVVLVVHAKSFHVKLCLRGRDKGVSVLQRGIIRSLSTD